MNPLSRLKRPGSTMPPSPKFLAALAFGLSALMPFAGTAYAGERPSIPQMELRVQAQGADAVRALGANLPAVAAHYGMSAEKLQDTLRRDTSARVDRAGRILFVEELAKPRRAIVDKAATSEGSPFPSDRTFSLHSRRGSNRVLYLDFDGYSTSGTAWNGGATIDAQPWDEDGDPTTFSIAEREIIQRVWVRVAEDFAPFDIDVTTEEPGLGAINRKSPDDDTFGTRVVITPNTFYDCYCGGVAYVGVFDMYGASHDYYQPAWVFNGDEIGIAEAASHEAGHNLGLWHDGTSYEGYYAGHGTGGTSWAPIMGVGYYVNVSQWSKGEYLDANNTEDDLSIIAAHGAPLAADDAGNRLATAARLSEASAAGRVEIDQSGRIGSPTDVDVYAFATGDGTLSLRVTGAAYGSNLDIRATLRDASGNVVAKANPPGELSASISTSVKAGTYYLVVEGVGAGDPVSTGYSDYGSLGRYRIRGSFVEGG